MIPGANWAARAAAVLVAVVLSGCSGDPFEPLPVPSTRPEASTTTARPDLSGVALAPVEGTTTTAEISVGPGPAILGGRVEGPDGPVAGATVRLERLVDDAVAVLDLATGDDGVWQADAVLGGRYRIRAWLVPELAAVEPQILFVPGDGTTEVVVRVQRFAATAVDVAVAPDPPVVGARTNVAVRVSSQSVDGDGVLRAVPRPGVALELVAEGRWEAEGDDRGLTDAGGTATFTLVCGAPGPQSLSVSIPPAEMFPLAVPDCVAPAPPEPPSSPPQGEPADPATPG